VECNPCLASRAATARLRLFSALNRVIADLPPAGAEAGVAGSEAARRSTRVANLLLDQIARLQVPEAD